MLKNHVGDSLLTSVIVVVLVLLCQIVILLSSSDNLYWHVYDTSNDMLIIVLSIALFNAIPYSNVQLKSTTAALIVWFIYVSLSNVLTDYGLIPVDDSTLAAVFMTMAIVIAYAFRFIFKWTCHKIPAYDDHLYLVIGKPTNLSQLIVTIYTGVGGSFGITDSKTLWHYSKPVNAMIATPLENGYLIGRSVDEICETSDSRIDVLNSMVGNEFSLINNCLHLHQLAKKWRN